jgi:hypothetical protein
MVPAGVLHATAGAVPLTAKTVSVAVVDLPKKPGTLTIQRLKVLIRPFVLATSLMWKTPARFVLGPCSGVPADRRRRREQDDEPIFYRLLFSGGPIDRKLSTRIADAIVNSFSVSGAAGAVTNRRRR